MSANLEPAPGVTDQNQPMRSHVIFVLRTNQHFLSLCFTSVITAPACHTPVEAPRKATSPTKSGHRRVLSDGGGELSPFVPPEVFQKLQTVESQDTSKR